MTKTMNFTDSLPTFDLDGFEPLFDELTGEHKSAAVELSDDYKHVRQPIRSMKDMRRVANAAKHLDGLPAAGETWHLISKGNNSQWDFIPAVLELAAPATIAYLGIATLGFSKSNLEELLLLLDAGTVAQVDFLYSVYFKSVEKSACERLQYELTRRGHRVACCRTHAKIILMQLSSGENFTIESSANLRSCRNLEQSTFSNDAALLQFHRCWMRDLFENFKEQK
jgi:hypothetical protein